MTPVHSRQGATSNHGVYCQTLMLGKSLLIRSDVMCREVRKQHFVFFRRCKYIVGVLSFSGFTL